MWRSAALIGALLALASWITLCLVAQPSRIEETLRLEVEQVLAGADLGDVRPTVDGRDVRLEGVVASQDASEEAERWVTGVAGVRVVDNLLKAREAVVMVQEAPLTYLEISILENGIRLRGPVPSEALLREVADRARLLFGLERVDDQLTVDPTVEDGAAMTSAAAVLSALAEVEQGVQARLKGESLRLSGTVANVESRRQVEQRMRAAAPRVRLFFSTLTVREDATDEPESGGI